MESHFYSSRDFSFLRSEKFTREKIHPEREERERRGRKTVVKV